MSWLTEVPFAHRGLHDADIPENSLAAFDAAAGAGYGIELDVQLSADREAVVVHDDDLTRVTNRPGRVSDLTVDALRGYRLGGTGEGIPMLGEVLDVVAGRAPIMVEIKHRRGVAGVLEPRVADVVRGYGGPVTIASFNPRSVGWFATHEPGVLRGQTAMAQPPHGVPGWLRPLLGGLWFNRLTRPHYVSYHLPDLPNRWTDAWRASGRPVIAWTVRTPADVDAAATRADNHIFEAVRP